MVTTERCVICHTLTHFTDSWTEAMAEEEYQDLLKNIPSAFGDVSDADKEAVTICDTCFQILTHAQPITSTFIRQYNRYVDQMLQAGQKGWVKLEEK